jgi:regulator of sigma D
VPNLVDYASAGHFEVYDQLIKEGKDFGDKVGLSQAAELYEVIDLTTEALLDFNDKYQETDDLGHLVKDLSEIGQHLETRFTAEDQMIEVLHTSHKELVA